MEMRIMDPEFGDKNVQIDKSKKAEVTKAKKLFEKLTDPLRDNGPMQAYGYKEGSKIGTLMRKFSTQFTRIVFRPPVTGG